MAHNINSMFYVKQEPWQCEMARATDKAVISKLYPNAKDISQPEPKE